MLEQLPLVKEEAEHEEEEHNLVAEHESSANVGRKRKVRDDDNIPVCQ